MSDISSLIHIVDNAPSVVCALKRLLRSWGMRVQTFVTGEEFLSALERSPDADCSVIDVQMPGINGVEIHAHLNHAGLDVPVIFITAHEVEEMWRPC